MVSILQPFVKKSYAQLSCSFVSKFGARFICPCNDVPPPLFTFYFMTIMFDDTV